MAVVIKNAQNIDFFLQTIMKNKLIDTTSNFYVKNILILDGILSNMETLPV